ncbi:Zinc transporter [Pseudogymnoascus australis]
MGTPLDNDVRGWIMTIASGIACVVGSSIICIDLVLNRIPRWKNFSIQDSSLFLACSMSLSFGVMIFSALYSMLPSSKKYLEKAEMSPAKASWLLLIFFILGFIGIQIISRFLHHYIPSQVVDCDHRHDESAKPPLLPAPLPHRRRQNHRIHPLLNGSLRAHPSHPPPSDITPSDQRTLTESSRRPSMVQVQNRVMSFVRDNKTNCDELGPCFGYSEPCGQECFKQFLAMRSHSHSRPPTLRRVRSHRRHSPLRAEGDDIESLPTEARRHASSSCGSVGDPHDHDLDGACLSESECCSDAELDSQDAAAHHHHVPENAFLNIGLQTSIAIALHKLPEGFITYATNHASPALGFSVFMALFMHNITEGFAMALPLYLALGSRAKAMCWSSVLGGVSQPLGAGIAVVWLRLAGHGKGENGEEGVGGPGFAVYGCMFAVTAGIMTSVALQLFVEGLGMCHRKELCIGCAVLGMALLGMSNALTAQ